MLSLLFRVLHGFISSGLTETQYISACKAARIGNVDERYITIVIHFIAIMILGVYSAPQGNSPVADWATLS